MRKADIFSILWLALKSGSLGILATTIFLPIPVAIGDYFGRLDTVGHYSGPLPATWICAISLLTALSFSPLFLVGGFVLTVTIVYSKKIALPRKLRGRAFGSLVGIFASGIGLLIFSKFELLEALGGRVFEAVIVIWGMILFGWMGQRLQQGIDPTVEHRSLPQTNDEPNDT